jgi:uncharacterized phage-associated protein
MFRAVDVAIKILKEAELLGIELSNLQLQKLAYITHGYFLAWQNMPLIREPIQAWTYGPVIGPIYHQYKIYGDRKIPSQGDLPTELDQPSGSAHNAVECIQTVLKLYGNMNAMELVNITHQRKTPWDEVWNERQGSNYYGAPIANELIQDHYRIVLTDPEEVYGL